MDLHQAEQLARELMDQHGVGEWAFGWNRRKRSLGLCRYQQRRIELSAYFVRDNGEEPVRDTVLHEIAHALAGERSGHGAKWKAMCVRLGCKPERCDKGAAVMPRGRWQANCKACGKEYGRHKRPQKGARYWCRTCGPERGAIVFMLNLEEARSSAA